MGQIARLALLKLTKLPQFTPVEDLVHYLMIFQELQFHTLLAQHSKFMEILTILITPLPVLKYRPFFINLSSVILLFILIFLCLNFAPAYADLGHE